MKFDELEIGMKATLTKVFTKEDVLKFAEASGDMNPIHVDEASGKVSIFGKCVVHGILASGLISAILGNKLPGEGTIYLGQDTKFLSPVFYDDEITGEVEVVELRPDKKIAKLATGCYNKDGKQVNSGTAVVKLSE